MIIAVIVITILIITHLVVIMVIAAMITVIMSTTTTVLVQYPGELKVNQWKYIGSIYYRDDNTPQRLKATLCADNFHYYHY